MSERIDKEQLVERVANRVAKDTGLVKEIVDATLEEIYKALEREE